jgi:hypothetical protein
VGLLIGGFRDGRSDTASTKAGPDGTAGVRLVRQDLAGTGTRTTEAASQDTDAVHDRVEHDRVVALAGGNHPSHGPTPAIRGEMDLRGQPAAGAP